MHSDTSILLSSRVCSVYYVSMLAARASGGCCGAAILSQLSITQFCTFFSYFSTRFRLCTWFMQMIDLSLIKDLLVTSPCMEGKTIRHKKQHFRQSFSLSSILSQIVYVPLDILFSSNPNIHKSSFSFCFWASDYLIERFK